MQVLLQRSFKNLQFLGDTGSPGLPLGPRLNVSGPVKYQ